MTYDETLSFIHSIPRMNKHLGLKTVGTLLERIGNPQKKLKFVHVAGTNGKGSTCAMLNSIFIHSGLKTGLYISPFILEFRERMQVNSQMIPREELVEITKYILPHWKKMKEEGEAPSEFELILAVALEYFLRQKCDVVVLEVGMGGRLDATNIIPPPLATVITSISFDHTQFLGTTLKEIAFEKASIIKKGSPVITYPLQPINALSVIMEHCAKAGNVLTVPNAEGVVVHSCTLDGSEITYGGEDYHIALIGEHQIYNALMVIEACKQLGINYRHIYEGIKTTFFPARMEILHKNPMIIIDGAHNLSGIEALKEALSLVGNKKIHGIIGMVSDKDVDAVVKIIAPQFATVVATYDKSNPRFLNPDTLREIIKPYNPQVVTAPNSDEALKSALASASPDDAILVCGSLYLASAARQSVLEFFRGDHNV